MATWLTIDFETRSAIDLRAVGVYRYAEHETTGVWCLAYALDDGPVRSLLPTEAPPDELVDHVTHGRHVRAWNAQFESVIWREILGPMHGYPIPSDAQWVCTAALAARAGLPRALDDAARVLGVEHQKDIEGSRLMLRMTRPRRMEGEKPIWWNDPKRLERLRKYNEQDVRAERAVANALPAVGHPLERRAWLLDQRINARGVLIDRPLVDGMLRASWTAVGRINERLKAVTDGRVERVSNVAKLKRWVGTDAPLDKAGVRDMLGGPNLSPEVREALELRREGGKSSIAKLSAMLAAANTDGRVRGMLLYYAATTGRWGGRLVQMHNFPRGTVEWTEDDVDRLRTGNLDWIEAMLPADASSMDLLVSALRGCLVAAPGHNLAVADFSAIEPRVLGWLASSRALLDTYRAGRSPYLELGAALYGRPISKTGDPAEYQVSKNTVLGCGYQMGAGKFHDQFLRQSGVNLDPELCERAVRSFRDLYWEVPVFWKAMNAAAVAVVANQLRTWTPVSGCGRLAFALDERDWLRMRLPSGRSLWYPEPRLVDRETPWGETRPAVETSCVLPTTHQWGRQALYGGLLTENAVQAVARDLMVEAMFRVEEAGYPVVLTVHDEIVAEPPARHGSVEEFCRLMSASPAWASDCPITAEGWRGARYRK